MKRIALIAALAACAAPAWAGQPVTLRPDVTDSDGVVTLGDIFAGAGGVAGTPVAARRGATVSLSAAAVQAAARRAGLDWANAEGLGRIIVRGDATAPQGGSPTASRGNVDVLTYARSLTAGEIIQPQDLVWGKAAGASADAATDADQMIGMAAKRPLRAGAVAGRNDVAAAQVVKNGEIVTVVYEDGEVSLALQGRAMGAAGVGEALNVQNTTSKKIVQAVVSGPGRALIGPAAERLRLATPSRYALR